MEHQIEIEAPLEMTLDLYLSGLLAQVVTVLLRPGLIEG